MKRWASGLVILIVVVQGLSFAVPDLEVKDTVSSSSIVFQKAREKYGDRISVASASSSLFSALLPDYELYRVYNLTFFPPLQQHTMAYVSLLNQSYDFTTEYNLLLQSAGISVVSSNQALNFSKLFASLGHAEEDARMQIVYSSDSSWLGVNVTSPTVSSDGLGWKVELLTWSVANGALANWTIRSQSTGIVDSIWSVRETDVGPRDYPLEGAAWRPGHWVQTSFGPTLGIVHRYRENGTSWDILSRSEDLYNLDCPAVASAENYDGSSWLVHWANDCRPPRPGQQNQSEALATALAQAGVFAYNTLVRDWGLPQFSSTGIHHIHVIVYDQEVQSGGLPLPYPCGPACVKFPSNETSIIVDANLTGMLTRGGFYTNSSLHNVSTIAKTVIAHEFLHVIQAGIYQWGPGGPQYDWFDYQFMTEGIARFAQSAALPSIEHDPTSLFYANSTTDGVQNFMSNSQRGVYLSYSFALPWGYFFSKDGGVDFLNKSMYAARNGPSSRESVNYTISQAMANSSGSHNRFIDAYQDLAFAMLNHSGEFVWGNPNGSNSKDWGSYLNPVYRREAEPAGSEYQFTEQVNAWGLSFVAVPTNGTYDITVTSTAPFQIRAALQGSSFSVVELQLNQTSRLSLDGLTKATVTLIYTGIQPAVSYRLTYRQVV